MTGGNSYTCQRVFISKKWIKLSGDYCFCQLGYWLRIGPSSTIAEKGGGQLATTKRMVIWPTFSASRQCKASHENKSQENLQMHDQSFLPYITFMYFSTPHFNKYKASPCIKDCTSSAQTAATMLGNRISVKFHSPPEL